MSETNDVPAKGTTTPSPTLAEAMYAVETLVQVFGFSVEVANQAVNEIGIDVTECYNYILDQGLGKDTGGAVYPIEHCPHVYTAVVTTAENLVPDIFQKSCEYHEIRRPNSKKKTGNLKETSSDDGTTLSCPQGENWLCLTCNRVLCSRYVNGHGIQHWDDTTRQDEAGHCVAASLADLSVWCHVCGAYLVHDEIILRPIIARLEEMKFPSEAFAP